MVIDKCNSLVHLQQLQAAINAVIITNVLSHMQNPHNLPSTNLTGVSMGENANIPASWLLVALRAKMMRLFSGNKSVPEGIDVNLTPKETKYRFENSPTLSQDIQFLC